MPLLEESGYMSNSPPALRHFSTILKIKLSLLLLCDFGAFQGDQKTKNLLTKKQTNKITFFFFFGACFAESINLP